MRARINANRVDVSAIGQELQSKVDRQREVKRELLTAICKRDNVRYSEARAILKQGVAWSLIAFELGMINK